ncbi:MAG: hypothetical protein N3I35_07655 [Clostridia bacterium]|nr:hypothetical protein [Clostridia bacterium]
MKKSIILVSAFILVLIISACGSVVKYTKEFSYLPSYPGMVLENSSPANEYGFSTASYSIADAKIEDIITEYEKLLHKNGWKTTDDKKPSSITVEKEKHLAVIVPSQNMKDTTVFIISK